MTGDELFAVLNGVLPGKAYRMLVPMDTPEPYLVFTRVYEQPQNTLCGFMNATLVHYTIDSYALRLGEAREIMSRVLRALRQRNDAPVVYTVQDLMEQDTRIFHTTADISTWEEFPEVQR